MNKDRQLWQFISGRLSRDESVILLIVAESSGSSPGRAGYKMAVAADGELFGSIGGGAMEVNLVEQSRAILSEPPVLAGGFFPPRIKEQVHQKNSPHASGMICSGRQTVILTKLSSDDLPAVEVINADLNLGRRPWLSITEAWFRAAPEAAEPQNCPLPQFERIEELFQFLDKIGSMHELFIIGGGHCALALSDLMSKLDFRITILDDRPGINTIEKNRFAHEIRLVESYESVKSLVPSGPNVYVVIMTLGYASDEIAVRSLMGKDIKYLGVLGSRAKMKVLINTFEKEGIDPMLLSHIHTPIGLPINSHSPEEIAVSIAAEIISIRNA